jgi:hypothetical protein
MKTNSSRPCLGETEPFLIERHRSVEPGSREQISANTRSHGGGWPALSGDQCAAAQGVQARFDQDSPVRSWRIRALSSRASQLGRRGGDRDSDGHRNRDRHNRSRFDGHDLGNDSGNDVFLTVNDDWFLGRSQGRL